MPDFNPAPAGGPDGALAWYNQSLAKVLGLSPADPTLPVDLLSELATDGQRRAIAAVIGRRFKRTLDAQTGAVSIDQIGDPLALAEPGEKGDPATVNLANSLLGAASAAVASVDPGQCIPGTCAETVAGMIAQIQSTIDLVRSEAGSPRSTFLMSMHLNELTDHDCGLVPKMIDLLEGPEGSAVETVSRERAIASLRIANRALGCFEEAIGEMRGCGDEPSLGEQAEIVRSCASNIACHVQNVRSALLNARISDFEIGSVEVEIGSFVQLSEGIFDRISFDQVLHVLESETRRWVSLIASGQRSGFDALERSAGTLKLVVTAINSGDILARLGILPKGSRKSEPREAIAASLGFQIDRMRAYALSVLNTVLCDPVGVPTPTPPRPRGAPPPTDEIKPIA